jgi:hypothetical protein
LTSKPRLIYIDPIRMKQKGAAQLSSRNVARREPSANTNGSLVLPCRRDPVVGQPVRAVQERDRLRRGDGEFGYRTLGCELDGLTRGCLATAKPGLPPERPSQRVQEMGGGDQRGAGTRHVGTTNATASP